MRRILIAPGFGSSGPIHWQTLWENAHPEYKRIEQKDWENPIREEWVAKIEDEVSRAGEDVVIVAHSLACLAVAFWVGKTKKRISGALLVAPPDSERADFPKEIIGFSPIPSYSLPFKTVVVSSTNDEYMTIERSEYIAKCWGSEFVNVGAKGHINSASGLGDWEEGKEILKKLLF